MTSRERFEEWRDIKANFYWTNVTPEQAAEAAWQAAERQTLERAAQICDENIDPAEAAYEIRALIGDASSDKEGS